MSAFISLWENEILKTCFHTKDCDLQEAWVEDWLVFEWLNIFISKTLQPETLINFGLKYVFISCFLALVT